MKRIEKIDPATLTGEPRQIFERWSPGGKPLNIVLIYFRNLELNRNWSYMATHLFMKNSLSDRQREIIVLRVSWQCASDYEFIQHLRIVREAQLMTSSEVSDLLITEPELAWPEEEAALIKASDELLASNNVSDETWASLRAHYGDDQLMDIVATAGGYTLNSMATNSFGIDIEDSMTREEGLVPSWNSPAFRFLSVDSTAATPAQPRLAAVDLEALDDKAKAAIAEFIERGERASLLSTLAGYPMLIRDWAPILRHVDHESTLNAEDRCVVAVTTAGRCGSDAEVQNRSVAARKAGVPEELVNALAQRQTADLSSERRDLLVRAVDELVDEMTVSDATWQALGKIFSDEQIMDVVFTTATELMVCWMHNALGIPPDALT